MARKKPNFVQTREFGKLGEEFVFEHFHELTNANLVLNNTMTAGKNTSGEDTTAYTAIFGNPDPDWLPDYVPLEGDRTVYPITSHQFGSNEVKTINSFLWRTNNNEDKSGTIGFELWEDSSRTHYGWAAKIFHPERFENARKPVTLTILLVAYGSPFASIHFPDISALYSRLSVLFHEDGLDADGFDFDTYPAGDEANGWQADNPVLDMNNWAVSLSRIEDLAIVTMIGDMPRIRPDIVAGIRRCSKETQLNRYDHLVELSDGRLIPQDTKYQYRICKDKTDEVFRNIDYDLSLVENQFWEQYPDMNEATSRCTIFNTLRLILENMLEHEYPAYPSDNPRYFQIGRDYYEKWRNRNDYRGSYTTFNGHIKILSFCGLINQFFSYDSNPDPVIKYLNRNKRYGKGATLYTVDFYTPEVMQSAEKVLVRLNNAHVLNGHITEQDFIRLFGRKAANKHYSDNRDTSEEEKLVEKTIVNMMKSDVRRKGYAIPAQIYHRAWVKLEKLMSTDDRNEMSKEKIIKAYRKMEKRLSSLAEENAGLSVRRIRNDDREKYGIPQAVQGNMITERQR